MRRKDRQVTDWQEICAILDACQVLHLGLQDVYKRQKMSPSWLEI